MGITLTLENTKDLDPHTWKTEISSSELRLFGDCKNSYGHSSVLLVNEPQYNNKEQTLKFSLDKSKLLNLGSSESLIVIDATSREGAQKIDNDFFEHLSSTKRKVSTMSDQDFLTELNDGAELSQEMQSVARDILESVREQNDGYLERTATNHRRFINRPDNFWGLTIQPRKNTLRFTVRGEPSSFTPGNLDLKKGRSGYTEFIVSSRNDLEDTLRVIQQTRKKS